MFFTLKQDLQKWCVYTHIYMYIHLPQQLKLRVTSRSVTIPWAESDQPKLDSKINIKQMSRCSGLSSVLFSSVTTLWCEQSDYIWPRFRCQQLPLFDNRSHTLWPFTHRSQVLGFHMWYHRGLMFCQTSSCGWHRRKAEFISVMKQMHSPSTDIQEDVAKKKKRQMYVIMLHLKWKIIRHVERICSMFNCDVTALLLYCRILITVRRRRFLFLLVGAHCARSHLNSKWPHIRLQPLY